MVSALGLRTGSAVQPSQHIACHGVLPLAAWHSRYTWHATADMYILDAAEAAGLDLPATCRGGICGACVGRVAAGGVDMSDIDDLSFTLSDDEVEQGMALLCMARATGNTTIETQCDWGYSLGVCEWKGATGRFSAAPDPLMGSSWSEAKQ